jgi:ribosome biogenesis GTPase / thiamine phosphate phosphatase
MKLSDLGWSPELAGQLAGLNEGRERELVPARVATVYAARVELWMELGTQLVSLRSRALRDAPIEGGVAVGDWVAVAEADTDSAVVEAILVRRTVFLRQAAGERSEPQAIAANIDRVFVVTAADDDLNPRRLERYLVAIRAGGAEARIALAKADLTDAIAPFLDVVRSLDPAALVTSAKTGLGIEDLRAAIPPGTTAALVGSSGVGKSALVNRLLGEEIQVVGPVREYDGRGRHTTTRRTLFVVPGGGLLVDTPGMRELKPWLPDAPEPTTVVDEAFEEIRLLAEACRYRDCLHAAEPGCAVRAAIASGALAEDRFDSWQKLSRERDERAARQATGEKKRRGRVLTTALRKRLKQKGR